jgi:glycosyltransferase involved in cell wall biosynthesis
VVTGYVPDDELPALYSACTVFLYPSLYEGFGLPALEAMSCGAAVVASDRSSLPEVVGDGGLLCNPDDPGDIAAKVRTLLVDPAARQRCSMRAQARAAEFSWEKTARSTYDVYARVHAHRRLRSTISVGDVA